MPYSPCLWPSAELSRTKHVSDLTVAGTVFATRAEAEQALAAELADVTEYGLPVTPCIIECQASGAVVRIHRAGEVRMANPGSKCDEAKRKADEAVAAAKACAQEKPRRARKRRKPKAAAARSTEAEPKAKSARTAAKAVSPAPRKAKAPRESATEGKLPAPKNWGRFEKISEAHSAAIELARQKIVPNERWETLPQFVRALAYKPRPKGDGKPRSKAAPEVSVPVAGVAVAIAAAIEAPLTAVGASADDVTTVVSQAAAVAVQHPEHKLYFAVAKNGQWAVEIGMRDADVRAKLAKHGFGKATIVEMPPLVSGHAERDNAYANVLDQFAERFCGEWNRGKATQARKSVSQVAAALEQDDISGPGIIPEMYAMPSQPEVTYAAPAPSAGAPVLPDGVKPEPKPKREAKPKAEPKPKRARAATEGQGDLMAQIEKAMAANAEKVSSAIDKGM